MFEIANTLSFNKDQLVNGYEYDYVTRTSQNQGVLQETGFVNQENINPAGTWSLGLLQMDFFYRRKPWYAGQFIRKVVPKIELTQGAILYFTVLLNKQKNKLLSGLVRDVDEAFLSSDVDIPVKNGEIDFEFMDGFIAELEAQRIAELEAQRIAELEAYLLVTGLKDYQLTLEEQQLLADFEFKEIKFETFRIEDVFEWQPQKEIDPLKLESLKDVTQNMYPFYGQSVLNNGIISYCQLTSDVLNNKNGYPTILIHSNNQNIVYLESPFYLKDGHGATSVLQCGRLNRTNQMFLVASIDKVIKSKYSYNHKATKIELKNSIIQLPTKNNQPDYEMMETFISAIQKLVIKDVVLYAEKKIQATKQAVTKFQ